MTSILQIQPVLPVRDVARAVDFYVDKLGFEVAFQDDPQAPQYAGLRRDGQELHLQWHAESDFQGVIDQPSIRFHVYDTDALFEDIKARGGIPEGKAVHPTTWGTREFEFYDPDGNALFFYQDYQNLKDN